MNTENLGKVIEIKVDELLADEPGYFVVEVSVRPTNNIKVFVDADQGVSIDRLTKLNRSLYKWIEENLFPNGDFSLEVSSPGLDEPLKLHRQFVKNIGRPVEVIQKDGIKKEGKLISVSDTGVVIEEEKARPTGKAGHGKKKEIVQHHIAFENIKTLKVQIKF